MDKEDRNALAVILTILVVFGIGFLWLDAKFAAVHAAVENNGKALAEFRVEWKAGIRDIRTDLRGLRTDIRALRMDIRALRTDVAVMLSEVGRGG